MSEWVRHLYFSPCTPKITFGKMKCDRGVLDSKKMGSETIICHLSPLANPSQILLGRISTKNERKL